MSSAITGNRPALPAGWLSSPGYAGCGTGSTVSTPNLWMWKRYWGARDCALRDPAGNQLRIQELR